MIGTIIYFTGVVLAIYPISQALLRSVIGCDKPDTFDRVMAGFLGCLAAIGWPAILVGYAMTRVSQAIWNAILGPKESLDTDSTTKVG